MGLRDTPVGGSSVDVADRAGRALGIISGTVDLVDRAARLLGHVTVDNFPALYDVSDRAARLLGHVNVDNFPATYDTSDRAGRLLGHVTVDAATIAAMTDGSQLAKLYDGAAAYVAAKTGQLPAALVGGRLDVNVGNAPSVDVSDRAARLLGVITAVAMTDGTQRLKAADLVVTALSAANAGVTLTLPAAGAGLFHYITSIEIVCINPTVTAIAAAASELTFTTTNLSGSPAWSSGNLLAAGDRKVVLHLELGAAPLKSAVANTATTIVAPAIGAGGKVRVNVTYYTAT